MFLSTIHIGWANYITFILKWNTIASCEIPFLRGNKWCFKQLALWKKYVCVSTYMILLQILLKRRMCTTIFRKWLNVYYSLKNAYDQFVLMESVNFCLNLQPIAIPWWHFIKSRLLLKIMADIFIHINRKTSLKQRRDILI